jgi:hypothetical protein
VNVPLNNGIRRKDRLIYAHLNHVDRELPFANTTTERSINFQKLFCGLRLFIKSCYRMGPKAGGAQFLSCIRLRTIPNWVNSPFE